MVVGFALLRAARSFAAHALVVAVASTPAPGRIWYVNSAGTGDAPTIKAAVEASAPGDTVDVDCGVYRENPIHIAHDIVIRSSSGAPGCVVLEPSFRAFACFGGSASFVGLTIRGAHGVGPEWGGAILVRSATATINDCIFRGNRAAVGVDDLMGPPASLTIANSTLEDDATGWALYVSYTDVDSRFSVRDCSFSGNAGRAMSVTLPSGGPAVLVGGCRFDSNGGVAALDVTGVPLGVTSCQFSSNVGSAIRHAAGDLAVSESDFTGNGGGIVSSGGSLVVEDCDFIGNERTGKGGAVDHVGGVARIVSCRFIANRATSDGGALFCGADSLYLGESEFRGNEAQAGAGGGVVSPGRMHVVGCQFAGNRAGTSGGALVASGLVLPLPIISTTIFSGNAAGTYGGALSFTDGLSPIISNCTIADNRSAFVAGGLNCAPYSFAQVERTVVWGNCALFAPQIYGPDVVAACAIIEGGWSGVDVSEADPAFCGDALCAVAPTEGGNYFVVAGSPCLPTENACGVLIGAHEEGCGQPTGVEPQVARLSWGAVKAQYR